MTSALCLVFFIRFGLVKTFSNITEAFEMASLVKKETKYATDQIHKELYYKFSGFRMLKKAIKYNYNKDFLCLSISNNHDGNRKKSYTNILKTKIPLL